MAEFVFCLGREPLLSLAELCSYLEAEGIGEHVERIARDVARTDLDPPPDPETLIRRLGGTVRIARTVAWLESPPPSEEATVLVSRLLTETARNRKQKLVFGFSAYPGRPQSAKQLRQVAQSVKQRLGQRGISARYVLPIRGGVLSSAQVIENRLVARGTEFLLGVAGKRGWLGVTLSVQPVSEETRRDMDKPARRLREGLLPPKVARIMVNLARTPETRSLLDPFCGSGVVLMEAMLLGLKPLGSDQSPNALQAARQNLEWLISRTKSLRKASYQLAQAKAEDLSLRFPPLSVDAVATEPYLGPPLLAPLQPDRAKALATELCETYIRALGEIRTALRPGGRCVFVVPVFRTRDGHQTVDLAKHLPLIGFREYNPLRICRGSGSGEMLRHSRPGQRVSRRILTLENRPE